MTFIFNMSATRIVAIALTIIVSSLGSARFCHAESAGPMITEAGGDQFANKKADTNTHVDCPEVYSQFKQMEQEYNRPQLWQGCDGVYEVAKHDNADEQSADTTTTSGFPYQGFTAFREIRHDGSTSEGVKYYGFDSSRLIWSGVSAQQIISPRITYNGVPDTLESVYVSFGGQLDYPVAPYVEFGVDLGDMLGQWFLRKYLGVDEDITDYYYSVGIQTRINQSHLFLRAYYIGYVISQEGTYTYVPFKGVGVGFSF